MMQADDLDGLRYTLGAIDAADGLKSAQSRAPPSMRSRAANTRFVDDHTPLHLAAADGNLQFCQVLVDAGADVNAVTRSINATPPMYAVPGTIASGADGMGDGARTQTLSFLLGLHGVDGTIR